MWERRALSIPCESANWYSHFRDHWRGFSNKTKSRGWGDGSVAKAPSALAEDSGSIPSTLGGSQPSPILILGYPIQASESTRHTSGAQMYVYTGKTHK